MWSCLRCCWIYLRKATRIFCLFTTDETQASKNRTNTWKTKFSGTHPLLHATAAVKHDSTTHLYSTLNFFFFLIASVNYFSKLCYVRIWLFHEYRPYAYFRSSCFVFIKIIGAFSLIKRLAVPTKSGAIACFAFSPGSSVTHISFAAVPGMWSGRRVLV